MISSAQRNEANDRYVTQRTPFLIYSNFELNESELVHEGSDNEISSYNLLNAAAELIGAPRSEYHQWLAEFGLKYPTYNNRMAMTMTEELKKYTLEHQMITYDRVTGKKYSEGR
ncbi:MAG: hypothetical protein IJ519_06185, partial [Clostridia bacterium]|nr:hypothetical protein [Clostridia bacterium]